MPRYDDLVEENENDLESNDNLDEDSNDDLDDTKGGPENPPDFDD